MKEAWVLRLKDQFKEDEMVGDYYFYDDIESDGITNDLEQAILYFDKESAIRVMKAHEKDIFTIYGKDAICNYGYTHMMKLFEFVEVTVEEQVG